MNTQSTASKRPSGPVWHPTEYPRILYKRRWVAIPAFLLVFLSGTIASVRTVPLFEASTQLLVERDARRVTTITGALEDRSGYYDDDFYPTQYRIMQSRALALRVVEALEAEGVRERRPVQSGFSFSLGGLFSAVRGTVGALVSKAAPRANRPSGAAAVDETAADRGGVDGFLGSLRIEPVRLSRLVDLKFRLPDPDYATRAVNELAKQYMQQTLESKFVASKEANDWLSAQLETQRQAVARSDAALQQYRESQNAGSIGDRQNIVVQKLTELNAQVTSAKIDRVDKEVVYNRILELRQAGQPLDSLPAAMTSDIMQRSKADIAALHEERARFDARGYGPAHPEVIALANRMTIAQNRLNAEVERIVDSMRNTFLAAQAKERQLVAALETQKGEAMGLDRKEVAYAALEREAVGNRQIYENLLQKTKETGISGEFRGSNVQVVDRAERPGGPVLPNVERDMMVAALLGALLAVGLGFGFEYFDSRIKSPEEIRDYLGLPFLGLVPAVADSKAQGGEAPMLSNTASPAFAEAIRAIRTAVLFSSAEEGARSVLVTSTGPSEGKTVIASSLAISLAQSGQKTLVIDADMRRPRLHEALGRSQEPGLSNVLVGESALADAARQSSVPNLWIFAAGHIPPNPAELLGSRKFLDVLAEAKKRFEWVVIDAPPVLPVTDAAVLGSTVGGVVFVIGAEMTPRHAVSNALEQLKQSRSKIVGVVLNRVKVHKHSYYYRAYYRKDYAQYYQRSADRA